MNSLTKYLLVYLGCSMCVLAVCPNGCSSHGKCVESVCICFLDTETGETYTGNDCSEHVCPKSNPFAAVSSDSSDGVNSSGGNRELDVIEEDKKKFEVRKLAEGEKAEISLVEKIEASLWKVKGLEVFTSIMPKSGGVLKCNFYTAADSATADAKEVDIRGFTDEYAYAKFSDDVSKIGDKDVKQTIRRLESAGEYAKVECVELLSMREDLVHYYPDVVTFTAVTTPSAGGDGGNNDGGGDSTGRQLRNNRKLADNVVTMTWSNYGPILSDMGLLKNGTIEVAGKESAKVEKTVKKNDKFRFGCFDKSSIDTKTPITIISNVTAVYDYSDNKKDVVFTFTSSLAAGSTYSCYCLMDGDGNVIDINETDLKDNIRKEDDNTYIFGAFKPENSITETTENNHVVILTTGFTDKKADFSNYDKKEYFEKKRVVYLTILNADYKITEERVEITTDYTVTNKGNYIIFPYIRTYPIDPSTALPTPVIAKTISSTAPFLYKVFYFAESVISGLNEAGGVIKCLNDKDSLLLNVKGVIKVDNNIMYSYIESSTALTDDILIKLNCYGIDSKRKDLSIYNPSEVEVVNNDITNPSLGRRILTDKTITWKGYSEILPILASSTVPDGMSFECYLPKDLTKKMVNLGITKIEKTGTGNIDIQFTIKVDVIKTLTVGEYTCYLLADAEGKKVDIDKSHLFSLIRKAENANEYYFGKYEVTTEVEIQKADDGSEVIPLDGTNNKIETSKITIASIKEGVKDKVMNKLKVGNKFQLKLHKTNAIYDEIIHEITITEVKESTAGRLLSTSLTVEYAPEIPAGYTSDNVLYDSIPKKNIVIGNAIDGSSNLYQLTDFNTDLVKTLNSIGGKLQCKAVKSTVSEKKITKTSEFISKVDVKGAIADGGYYQFDFPLIDSNTVINTLKDGGYYYIDDIVCDKVLSNRNDLTFWNPSTVGNGFTDTLSWTGYGIIAKGINLTLEAKSKMACYNPSDSNKLITIYNVSNTINPTDDITFKFDEAKKPSEKHICYLLAGKDGKVLDIENSELSSLISKDNSGNYYYGEYVDNNNNNNKDESNVVDKGGMKSVINVDGSIKSTIDMGNIIISGGGNDDDKKLDLSQASNVDNPTILIPPTMIDTNIQKMITGGTKLKITIHYEDGSVTTIDTQILKAGKNENGKFSLVLSEGIPIQTELPRLRSLASGIKLIEITWESEGSTHIALECSGQGSCDRSSGICKCYDGFSGSACQRLDCPNNCNGNGRCVPLSELLSNDKLKEYVGFGNKHESELKPGNGDNAEFDNQVFGCLCDKRHRGYDCSLIECPSGKDPEEATNAKDSDGEYRDCSGRGICNYNTGVCECFDGFSGEGCQTMAQMM